MKIKLLKRKSTLAIIPLIVVSLGIFIQFSQANSAQSNFEHLKEDMTIEEAFAILQWDIKKCEHSEEYFDGALDTFRYKSPWYNLPRREFGLSFFAGKLSSAKKREIPLSHTWEELFAQVTGRPMSSSAAFYDACWRCFDPKDGWH